MPSDLKACFEDLGPIAYTDIPTNDLPTFLKPLFEHAEILANSVPAPPPTSDLAPLEVSSLPAANSAKTPQDTLLDPSSLPTSKLQSSDPDITKAWGKPVKISAKDNPLRVAVFKMSGHDRHGAWFARRSVHAGLGFDRFKRAMQREFLESLDVREGPGSGSVRGIAADRRLEQHDTEDGSSVSVWQVSSAFPGPVTPREFMTLSITTEKGTSDSSHFEGIEQKPRTFIVISRPTEHEDAPARSGLVKGTYESIEMIREVPVEGVSDHEQNPVEWIMVTRSDPGGGIPRFMVEKGTPGSIVADVPKWLTWAIKKGDIPDSELQLSDEDAKEQNEQRGAQEQVEHEQHHGVSGVKETTHNATSSITQTGVGLLSSVQHAVEGYLPAYFQHPSDGSDAASTTSVSSDESFASAVGAQQGGVSLAAAGELPAGSDAIVKDIEARGGAQDHHERELLKIHAKREALDKKIADARASEKERMASETEKDEKDRKKAEEKLEKERKKQEENYNRQIEKLNQRQEKEAKKVEERRRKAEAKDVLLSARRERDEAQQKLKMSEEEVELLKKQIESLQKENSLLATKLGSSEFGSAQVHHIGESMDAGSSGRRSRASSRKSIET